MDIEAHLLIDRAVSHFEENWFSSNPVSIEDVLTSVDDTDRRILLSMLLESDIELRLETLQEIPVEAYLARFPTDQDLVSEVLGRFQQIERSSEDGYESADPEIRQSHSMRRHGTNSNLSNFRVFGPYIPIQIIARGGMGVVMEAVHKTLRRRVAIKVVRLDRINERLIERFKQEAQAAAAVQHPNVVRVHDQNVDRDCWYMAMELIEGVTLSEFIKNQSRDIKQLLTIVASVADGLQAAHVLGVVHRDIKPHNILIRPDGTPVIVDFGLARLAEAEHLTKTGEFLGTPAYAAPEQMLPAGQISPQTDIHALGVILYEIATGNLPYKGQNAHQVMRRIIEELPASPKSVEPLVSKDLDTIILKCLEKVPSNRYTSALALAEDLRSFIAGYDIVARPTSAPVWLWRAAKRKPYLATWAGFATLALSLVSIAAIGFMRSAKAEAELAKSAIARRDEADRNSARSLVLVDEANAARNVAEEMARYSEGLQLQATMFSVELSTKLGQLDQANRLVIDLRSIQPQSTSFDTRWYERISDLRVKPLAHFCTSNWGLYDYCLSPDKTKIATADKTGRVDIWDLMSGRRIAKLEAGAFDLEIGTCRPRWQFLCGRAASGISVPFYSSIAWEQDGRHLLLASVDGRIQRRSIDGERREVLVQSERPFYWLRLANEGRFVTCDDQGELTEFTSDGKLVNHYRVGADVSVINFEPRIDKWLVGDRSGNIRILDSQLQLVASHLMGSQVFDCAVVEGDSEHLRILVSAESQPIIELRGRSSREGWSLDPVAVWEIPNRELGTQIWQAKLDSVSSQLLALDNHGTIHLWQKDRSYTSLPIGQPTEIRIPTEDEARTLDWLEDRNGLGLFKIDGAWCQISRLGTVKLFDANSITNNSPWIRLKTKLGPRPQLAHAEQQRFWALDADGRLSYLDCLQDRIVAAIEAHEGGRAELVVLSNGQVVTVGGDETIKFWRIDDGVIREVRQINAGKALASLAVHEGTSRLAAVAEDGELLVFGLMKSEMLYRTAATKANDSSSAPRPNKSEVLTGRVAFSCSGKFIGSYGLDQEVAIYDTKLWQCHETDSHGIAGNGGTVIQFSPVADERLVMGSTIDTHANCIGPERKHLARFPKEQLPNVCIDSQPTNDRRRIAILSEANEIVFLSGEHLQKISSIPVPVVESESFAFGTLDLSVVVAGNDGELVWAPFEHARQSTSPHVLDGKVVRPIFDGAAGVISPANVNSPYAIQDRNGSLMAVFQCGQTRSLTDPTRRSFLLSKAADKWSLRKIEFDGVDDGPAQSSQVFLSPVGKPYIVLRQGMKDGYDGRTILLHPTDRGGWTKEVVVEKGNLGFNPLLRFDETGGPVEIIHFDHEFQRLMQTRRLTDGQWNTAYGVSRAGCAISYVSSSMNNLHFLLTPLQGNGSDAPYLYAELNPGSSERIKAEDHWNAPGGTLMRSSKGIEYCIDKRTGSIYERMESGSWKHLARWGDGFLMCLPCIDSLDRLWFCSVRGQELDCYCYDFDRWNRIVVRLNEAILGSVYCYCFVSPIQQLSILAVPLDVTRAPLIIEAQLPDLTEVQGVSNVQ